MDERIRIRLSFCLDNEEDVKILNYLNKFEENKQAEIKRILINYISDSLNNKVCVDKIYYDKREKKQEGKKGLFKRKRNNKVYEIEYKVKNAQLTDFKSLEDYAIDNKFEADVLTMMTLALECGVDKNIIVSMVENNLSAKQMKMIIDLILTEQQMNKSKIASLKKTDNTGNVNVKFKDPLAIELKDINEND